MGKPQAATVMSGSDLRVVVDCGRRFTGPPRSATTEAPHFTFGARAYWGLLVWGARPGNWGPSRPGGAQRVDRVGGDARCAMGMGNGRAGDGPTDRPMRAVAATLATPGQPRAHLNQFRDGHLRALPGFDPGATHWRVIGVVATLAERQEVGRSAILRLMIQVRDGQNDAAAGGRMRFAMTCIAARAFAAPLRTIAPDRQADLPPVLRIAIPVFRADRHLHRLRLAQALDLGAQAAAVVVQRGDARVLDTDADLQRADLRGLALQQLGGVYRLGRLAQGRGASVGSTAPRAGQKIGVRQGVPAARLFVRPLPERRLRLGHGCCGPGPTGVRIGASQGEAEMDEKLKALLNKAMQATPVELPLLVQCTLVIGQPQAGATLFLRDATGRAFHAPMSPECWAALLECAVGVLVQSGRLMPTPSGTRSGRA